MTATSESARQVPPRSSHETGPAPPQPTNPPWTHRVARLGLVFRGLLYAVPGALAVLWALSQRGSQRGGAMSQMGVLAWLAHKPFAPVLLGLAATGFGGYCAWGVARAFADPLHRGYAPRELGFRLGYATSAVAYFGLFLATVRLLVSPAPRHLAPHPDWTVSMLARPFGGVFVALIGLVWIFGSGISQVVMGVTGGFARDLAIEDMSASERRWLMTLGRIGITARGLVFTVIGVLIVAAALRLRSRSGTGLDEALLELGSAPGGRVLVGIAGAGLVTFGAFSMACVRWMRMHRPTHAS